MPADRAPTGVSRKITMETIGIWKKAPNLLLYKSSYLRKSKFNLNKLRRETTQLKSNEIHNCHPRLSFRWRHCFFFVSLAYVCLLREGTRFITNWPSNIKELAAKAVTVHIYILCKISKIFTSLFLHNYLLYCMCSNFQREMAYYEV